MNEIKIGKDEIVLWRKPVNLVLPVIWWENLNLIVCGGTARVEKKHMDPKTGDAMRWTIASSIACPVLVDVDLLERDSMPDGRLGRHLVKIKLGQKKGASREARMEAEWAAEDMMDDLSDDEERYIAAKWGVAIRRLVSGERT